MSKVNVRPSKRIIDEYLDEQYEKTKENADGE